MYNLKPGGGGKPQEYIPKGNGERSGQYTSSSYGVQFKTAEQIWKEDTQDFCRRYNSTEYDLNNRLSLLERTFVNRYSIPEEGVGLNAAIRKDMLCYFDVVMRDNIIAAVNKSPINEDLLVYRGIGVDRNTFVNKFYIPYIKDQPIDGSTICSTSRDLAVAFMYARTSKQPVKLIFNCLIPKGHPALPIEAISRAAKDKEILLIQPKYLITDIKKLDYDNSTIYRVDIKLVR